MLKSIRLREVSAPHRSGTDFDTKALPVNGLRAFEASVTRQVELASTVFPRELYLMADTPILLREQQYHQIKAVLARLRMDSSARVVFLVDKDGQEIAVQGEVGNLDTTSLASLAAGNVAATGGMAELIGEKEFPTLSHEGERQSIHISVIGRLLLVIVFDERSSLGLVKLRSKQIAQQLAAVFDEITKSDYDDLKSPFAEITDEDIDSLFT